MVQPLMVNDMFCFFHHYCSSMADLLDGHEGCYVRDSYQILLLLREACNVGLGP